MSSEARPLQPVLIHQVNKSSHVDGSQFQFTFVDGFKGVVAGMVKIEIALGIGNQAGYRCVLRTGQRTDIGPAAARGNFGAIRQQKVLPLRYFRKLLRCASESNGPWRESSGIAFQGKDVLLSFSFCFVRILVS